MASFDYIARTRGGRRLTGVIHAQSQRDAAAALADRQMFPVSIAPSRTKAVAVLRRVRARDLGVLYGQIADLVRAGVPMLRAMETLMKAASNPVMREVIRRLRDDLAAGKSLADAMADDPATFPVLHVAMVRAGERGSFLEQVLTNLATFIERQDELRAKVIGALIYPVVLVVIGGSLLGLALVVMVPKFKPMFEGSVLPLPTQVLFGVSDVLVGQWHVVGLGVMLAAVGMGLGLRGEGGRRFWDRLWPWLPVVGLAMRMVCITRFCRILGTMLANGVPMLQALAIAKDATGSGLLAGSIAQAAENVRAGQPLTEPLRDSGMFPPEVIEMISVAESSNRMESILVEIADTVERRTNRRIDQVVGLIEPGILVLLAIAVGFVAVGLLYPIFTMAQALR